MQSFAQYKVCLFSVLSKVHIVDTGYPQGTISPIFVAEEFSELSAYPSIFLNKDSISA